MSTSEHPNADPAARRRRQLHRWINAHYEGSQSVFAAATNDGTKQINGGELSGLLRKKSFGEKRARSLERQAGMPHGYLDSDIDPAVPSGTTTFEDVPPQTNVVAVPAVRLRWPFKVVTYQRVLALQKALGPKRGAEALRDIDELLDVAMGKWERLATHPHRIAH